MKGREKRIFKKVMSRELPVISCQYWDAGERVELPKICENALAFTPLFVHQENKGTAVYYDFSDVAQDPVKLADYFNRNEDRFDELVRQYRSNGDKLLKLSKKKAPGDFLELYQTIAKFWSMLAVGVVLGGNYSNVTNKSISDKAYKLRVETDKIIYIAGNVLIEIIGELLPGGRAGDAEFLTFEEISRKKLPPRKILNRRRESFIYFKGKLIEKGVSEFAAEEKIDIEKDEAVSASELKGTPACRGKAGGAVKIIFESKQFDKVNKGDVLVTPMTTPDFLPIMKKAAAIVTDEGGITCHAAIVAREIKKPCIIGTKIATQVLKDGMLVAVDADQGVVRILEKR